MNKRVVGSIHSIYTRRSLRPDSSEFEIYIIDNDTLLMVFE